jgi:hypothetical protein
MSRLSTLLKTEDIKAEGALSAPYNFPDTFIVGGRSTIDGPLVTVEHLKQHLQALSSFHALRETVEKVEDTKLPELAREMDKPQRWTWFVSLAVER